jgi:hypothetical protein
MEEKTPQSTVEPTRLENSSQETQNNASIKPSGLLKQIRYLYYFMTFYTGIFLLCILLGNLFSVTRIFLVFAGAIIIPLPLLCVLTLIYLLVFGLVDFFRGKGSQALKEAILFCFVMILVGIGSCGVYFIATPF